MFVVGFLGWWYGPGWRARIGLIGARLLRVFDYFSIDLLLKTWFSPFRQIGTSGQAAPGFPEQIKAFFDQLVSRVIGSIVRSIMMVAGAVALIVMVVVGSVELLMWLFVPLFPIAGGILFAIGWVPHVGL